MIDVGLALAVGLLVFVSVRYTLNRFFDGWQRTRGGRQ